MFITLLTIILTLTLSSDGVHVTVTTSAPCACYVQVDATDGLAAAPQIFLPNLATGQTFATTVQVAPRPGLYFAPQSVRVRVWDGATNPSADEFVSVPMPPPHHVYVPLL